MNQKTQTKNSDRGYCAPACDVCDGHGYVRDTRTNRVRMCPRNPELANMDVTRYGLPNNMRNLDWDSVLNINGAADAAARVRAVVERGYGWIYLWGDYGLAKSLIGQVAVAVSLRRGTSAAIILTAEFLEHLKSAFKNDNPQSISKLEFWQERNLLVLDEFDAFNETSYAHEQVRLLLQKRYNSAAIDQNGITIFTSNKSPAAIPAYIQDRLRDERLSPDGNCIIHMQGKSMRPQASALELD